MFKLSTEGNGVNGARDLAPRVIRGWDKRQREEVHLLVNGLFEGACAMPLNCVGRCLKSKAYYEAWRMRIGEPVKQPCFNAFGFALPMSTSYAHAVGRMAS